MKVTFIDPPNLLGKKSFERVFGCTYSLYPIPNIFSLSNAALLEKEGFEVSYVDMANEKWSLGRCKRFLLSDNSSAYILYSVNLSLRSDLLFYEHIRKIRRDAVIVFSGPGPTYFTSGALQDERTYVVRGETELSILGLMCYLKEGGDLRNIKGISFLEEGRVIDNPARPLIDNLDQLPYPARHLLKRRLYYNPKLDRVPFTAIQTSRNCSYRCAFCVPNSYNFARELEYKKHNNETKPPVRMRSAENVIAEFKFLKREGYKSVSIIDDQFLWDEERTLKICSGVANLGIEWGCLARADRINPRVASSLSASGCRYVDIGVESFNQAVLDDTKKDLKVGQVFEAVDILKRYGIMVKINLVFGVSALQTKEIIREDIKISKELKVDAVMFSLATPFPGTEFYKRAKENHWFTSGGYRPENVQTKAIISYPSLTEKELNRMLKTANLSFYLSPRFIIKNSKRLFNPLGLYRGLAALKRKLT